MEEQVGGRAVRITLLRQQPVEDPSLDIPALYSPRSLRGSEDGPSYRVPRGPR